ncbi:MAG: hypothetical protein HRF51_03325 [bacterium]|jgi:hypothetical protein
MLRKAIIMVFAVAAVFLMGAQSLLAQSPNTITYQGKLTNAAGAPITTATNIVFSIWTAVSGGSSLWTETHNGVTPDANGVFTVELGTTTPLTNAIFDGSKRFLQITAGGEVMTPRQVLNNAPYSFAVENVPGIARGKNSGSVSIATTGVTNITSATIVVPGPGYVVARAHAYAQILGTPIGNIISYIETSATATAPSGEFTATGFNDYPAGAYYFWASVAPERTFVVGAAGSYTYYFNSSRGWTGGTASMWYSKLTLTYYPVAYGTVTTSSAAPELEPDNAEWNPVFGPDPSAPQEK